MQLCRKVTISLVCMMELILIHGSVKAEPVDYSGHALASVLIQSRDDVEELNEISPDIWSEHIYFGQTVFARIPPNRMNALKRSSLVFDIVDDDLGPELSSHYPKYRIDATGAPGDFRNNYQTLEQMVAIINNLKDSCPSGLTCNVVSAGKSIEERDLWVLSIRDSNSGQNNPAVYVTALQHAREWISGSAALCFADYIVNTYASDSDLRDLMASVTVYISPCINPDGYKYSWDNERLWRKNRRDNGDGEFGVDLNRNWGFQWGYDDEGSSPETKKDTYRGTAAFSEPETESLSDFIIEHPKIKAFADIHSYSQYMLAPYAYAKVPLTPVDDAIYDSMGDELSEIIAGVNGKTYTYMHGIEFYPTNGSSVEWQYVVGGGLALGFELRPEAEDEQPGFRLDESEIAPTCDETTPAFLHMLEWAADNSDFHPTLDADTDTDTDTGEDTDTQTDTADTDSDMDTDSDTGGDSDTDSDSDTDTDNSSDQSGCGCSAVGVPSIVRALPSLIDFVF